LENSLCLLFAVLFISLLHLLCIILRDCFAFFEILVVSEDFVFEDLIFVFVEVFLLSVTSQKRIPWSALVAAAGFGS